MVLIVGSSASLPVRLFSSGASLFAQNMPAKRVHSQADGFGAEQTPGWSAMIFMVDLVNAKTKSIGQLPYRGSLLEASVCYFIIVQHLAFPHTQTVRVYSVLAE